MPSSAALLWDESFLWGLIACRALKGLSLDFSLVTSEDIKQGALEGKRLLYVPGGWASNKLASLGDEGARRIKKFVEGGGSYIGVCGGAGLATSEGIGLLDIKRRPLEERVPSLSGKIMARAVSPHPFWNGITGKSETKRKTKAKAKSKTKSPFFHIWWPSQFKPEDPSIKIVASFEQATQAAFSSDLNVGSVHDWKALEAEYRLNLDPERMHGEPLALEGACGAGRVFLTLIHLDTPRDANGAKALQNLWMHLGGEKIKAGDKERRLLHSAGRSSLSKGLLAPVEELFELGRRNFLWFKEGWIVRWRRGIRGLEYFTLYELVKELAQRVESQSSKKRAILSERREYDVESLIAELRGFADKAGRLLMLERMALQRGETLTFSRASDPEMASLRAELFSNAKSHGGEFKEVLGKVDGILFEYLKHEF